MQIYTFTFFPHFNLLRKLVLLLHGSLSHTASTLHCKFLGRLFHHQWVDEGTVTNQCYGSWLILRTSGTGAWVLKSPYKWCPWYNYYASQLVISHEVTVQVRGNEKSCPSLVVCLVFKRLIGTLQCLEIIAAYHCQDLLLKLKQNVINQTCRCPGL